MHSQLIKYSSHNNFNKITYKVGGDMGGCDSKQFANTQSSFDESISIIKHQYTPNNHGPQYSYKHDAPSPFFASKVTSKPKLSSAFQQAINRQIKNQPLEKPEEMGMTLPTLYIQDFKGYYQGQWKRGLPHGYGKFYIKGKIYFEGSFLRGRSFGKDCFLVYPDGSYKRGEFKNGKMEGYGKFYYAVNGLTYEGEWSEDKPHGKGKESYPDGGFYSGQFVNGVKQGEGQFQWADGRLYIGQFKDGLMHGNGTLKKQDGKGFYEGQFEKNLIQGKGKMYTQKGIYEGNIISHQMSGEGAFKWYDGRQYKGSFKSNKLHGQGTLIQNGKATNGVWQDGVLCESVGSGSNSEKE